MRIIDYFFISVTEGVICKIKMKTFGSEREIQAYTYLMENRLPITLYLTEGYDPATTASLLLACVCLAFHPIFDFNTFDSFKLFDVFSNHN